MGWVSEVRSHRIGDVRHDRRPVKEQVESGFLIAVKFVSAFCIAVTFFSGYGLIHEAGSSSQSAVGWLLINFSVIVMAVTVRVWAAGFVGFTAYAALRVLVGTLFLTSWHVSPLLMLRVAGSLLAMSVLGVRFASGNRRVTQIERASLVLAAICVLLSLLLMDSYRSVGVLNVGNVALGFSWFATRSSRRQSVRNSAAID